MYFVHGKRCEKKSIFDGQKGFSFKVRAELLWSLVGWKSILHTFVGIVCQR